MNKRDADWVDLVEFFYDTVADELPAAYKERGKKSPPEHLLGKSHHRIRLQRAATWSAENY